MAWLPLVEAHFVHRRAAIGSWNSWGAGKALCNSCHNFSIPHLPDIAAQLYLGLGTVKGHVRDILEKLSANDRTQAAVNAYRRGLL